MSAGEIIGALFGAIDRDGSGAIEETEGKTFLLATGCPEGQISYYWQDLLRTADTDDGGQFHNHIYSLGSPVFATIARGAGNSCAQIMHCTCLFTSYRRRDDRRVGICGVYAR